MKLDSILKPRHYGNWLKVSFYLKKHFDILHNRFPFHTQDLKE